MLPLNILRAARLQPILVELKNGEAYNGKMEACDTWMNMHLREVICTAKDGEKFWRMKEVFVRGNTIKYIRVPEDTLGKAMEYQARRSEGKPMGYRGSGRGRGRGTQGRDGGRGGRGGRGRGA
eukprot:jgi/Ulvmu1/11944/UM082_0023.1